jgi:hypothetical protein
MYVYIYWTSDNYQQTFQAFYKADKGITTVVDSIANMVAATKAEHKNSKKSIPKEIEQLETLASATASDKSLRTVDNAKALIDAWEDYLYHVVGKKSKCHQFSEITPVE